MRPIIRFLARLYPPRWRRRYGAEFDILLDDASPDAKTAFNVFSGALSMQIRTWNVGKILAIAGLAGALVALGIALTMPKRYTSQSVLKITSATAQDATDQINSIVNVVVSRNTLTGVVQTLGLYIPERARTPIEDVIEGMKREIHVLPVASTGAGTMFAIQFSYVDPTVAQKVTNALTSKFIQENLRVAHPSSQSLLQVLDPASLPQRSSFPSIPNIAFVGLLGGLAVGAISILFLRRRAKAA